MPRKKNDHVRVQVFVPREVYDKLVERVERTDAESPMRVSMSGYCAHVLGQHVAGKKRKGRK